MYANAFPSPVRNRSRSSLEDRGSRNSLQDFSLEETDLKQAPSSPPPAFSNPASSAATVAAGAAAAVTALIPVAGGIFSRLSMFRSSPVSGGRYVSQVRPEPRGGKDGCSDIDEGDSVHGESSSLLRPDAKPFPTPTAAAGGLFGGYYGGGGGGDGGFRKGKRRLRTLAACAALVVAALVLAACAVVDVADAWLGFRGTRRAAGLERCVPQDIPVPSLSEMTVEEKVGQMMQIDERALGYGGNITVYHIGSVLSSQVSESLSRVSPCCRASLFLLRPFLGLGGNITVYHIGSVLSGGGGWPQYAPNTPTAWADMVDNFQAKALNTHWFPSSPCAVPRVVSYASGGGGWLQYAPNTPTAWADMVDNFQAKALNTRLRVLFPVCSSPPYNPPSVVSSSSGGGGWPQYAPNTPTAWADMVDNFQAKALNTRLRVPVLYGVDAVHGHNNVEGATIFPHHVGLGAAGNASLVEEIAAAVAKEVAATGVRWTFAPAVTVCLDPRWGRCYESYGADPGLVTELAIAEIRGWMYASTLELESHLCNIVTKLRFSNRITVVLFYSSHSTLQKVPPEAGNFPGSVFMAPTAKHYVGDGGTRGGVDRGETVGGEAELRKVHLLPYVAAVAEGVSTIMASYSSWNGIKMHGNG
ncbi:unnamed protein product [Closterium sp. Yama58-4]|nr:unnamed protein product [Closterium sp. Yama58-4]